MSKHILAIDQGTTSSRAIVFDEGGNIVSMAAWEFPQYFPRDGWVEHDPEEIWSSTIAVVRESITRAGLKPADILTIGITNQRETTVIWDRRTGQPIHRAIVWQDRRTARFCDALKAEGFEDTVRERTGLLLDPYFSGTKVAWLLDNVAGARERAERGELAFGTIDTFLLWRLTGGEVHRTDATNASRTLLYNIHTGAWDETILARLRIPASMMPQVLDCAADFGVALRDVVGADIPVNGIAGDQQAALFGQCCFDEGMIKSTYGTGCFVMMNTGTTAVVSSNKLLTTIGYQLGGVTTYALEGSIFVAGAAVQWLRDGLRLIRNAAETEAIASSHPDAGGTYLVPAFTGLGAPYWDADARGALIGLTRDTTLEHIVTATLQSVCLQTRDLLLAMAVDGIDPKLIRIDGGMVVNNWVAQNLADVLQIDVDRPVVTETTALGAAYLAGLGAGLYRSPQDLGRNWQLERRFTPVMSSADSDRLYRGWQAAVARVRTGG